MVLVCVLLGYFHNFSLDPYYEPQARGRGLQAQGRRHIYQTPML